MSPITRRQVITATLAGAVGVAVRPRSARAGPTDGGPAKLIQHMESLRTRIPPPQGLGELNGRTLQELEPYTTSHLSGVATRLGAKSRADCLVLLTYLNEPDARLRFIAAQAIYGVVDGYRNGIDSAVDNILDTQSDGYRKLVCRFVELIDKLGA